MKYSYITFRSVTYAQRAERLLKKEGIRSTLRRTPKWMEEKGCGYSLQIKAEEVRRAAALLDRAGIPLRKIYSQRPDGNLEEMGS